MNINIDYLWNKYWLIYNFFSTDLKVYIYTKLYKEYKTVKLLYNEQLRDH